ncbi:Golgi-associated plant pathogenesis-related protein 1-like [Oculina patagonica]
MFRESWVDVLIFLVIFWAVGNVGFSNNVQDAARIVAPHQSLQAHNRYRSLHHSPPLNWSEGLATEAQAIAQSLVAQDLHSGRKDSAMDLGQNLAKLAGSMACEDAGEIATNLWYSQAKNYSYSDPRLNADTDTFTQVIWRETKEVGIGCARSSVSQSGPMYIVALYKPAGNIPKLLRQNVLEPGPRGQDPDVYSTLFRRQFEEAKSLGRIQRKLRGRA